MIALELTVAVLLGLAAPAAAFPAAALTQLQRIARVANLEDIKVIRREEAKRQVSFDPVKQSISTSGTNKFVVPNFAAGDQRGSCQGLNALANHGYLPNNGVAGMNDIVDATGQRDGMAPVYGTVFDGNPLSLSPGYLIGGVPPKWPVCQRPQWSQASG